jgi:hypothetical protein
VSAITGTDAQDIFVAKYDPGGTLIWSKHFGNPQDNFGDWNVAEAVAVDASGNVIITGELRGSVDFGGGAITGSGVYDAFAAKFDANGNHLWSKTFGVQWEHRGLAVVADTMGNVILAGEMSGDIDFGGGALTATDPSDAFLAKLGPDGHHIWSKAFGGSNYQGIESLALTPTGDILLTGLFDDFIDLGCGPMQSPMLSAGYVHAAKFAPSGACRWSTSAASMTHQYGRGIASGDAGQAFVTGRFSSSIDFGLGTLLSAGKTDVYAAALAP